MGAESLAAPILGLIGTAVAAGAQVGGAFVLADAQKTAVRQQTKADLVVALAQARAQETIARVQSQGTTQQFLYGSKAAVVVAVAVALAVLASRRRSA